MSELTVYACLDRWVQSVPEQKSNKKANKEKKKATDETSTLLNSKGWQKHWVKPPLPVLPCLSHSSTSNTRCSRAWWRKCRTPQ